MMFVTKTACRIATLTAVIAVSVQAEEPTTSIQLRFPAIEPKGTVRIAIFDEAGWDALEQPVSWRVLPATDGGLEIEIRDLPPNNYGVSAYQDLNDNDKLDRKFSFGPPSEPYGFSNSARGRFGPPPWDEVAFEVRADQTTVQVMELR